ncbi:hypothetical protein EDB83DRAFT_1868302 [Lactarius deliciosus]|nr:hypothetical protein EDB83DRAFT_1868302 [Lactarius deliciosus]
MARISCRWCVYTWHSNNYVEIFNVLGIYNFLFLFFLRRFSLRLQCHVTQRLPRTRQLVSTTSIPRHMGSPPPPPRRVKAPPAPTPCRRDTRPRHHPHQPAARKPRHDATQTRGVIPYNRRRGVQIPTSDDDGTNTGDTRPTTTMATNARLTMRAQYIKISFFFCFISFLTDSHPVSPAHVTSASRASLFKLQALQVLASPYVGPTSTLCQSTTITPPRPKTCTDATPSRLARPTTTPTCVLDPQTVPRKPRPKAPL